MRHPRLRVFPVFTVHLSSFAPGGKPVWHSLALAVSTPATSLKRCVSRCLLPRVPVAGAGVARPDRRSVFAAPPPPPAAAPQAPPSPGVQQHLRRLFGWWVGAPAARHRRGHAAVTARPPGATAPPGPRRADHPSCASAAASPGTYLAIQTREDSETLSCDGIRPQRWPSESFGVAEQPRKPVDWPTKRPTDAISADRLTGLWRWSNRLSPVRPTVFADLCRRQDRSTDRALRLAIVRMTDRLSC